MKESNNLTEKKFWNENWKGIKLPARYWNNRARKLISDLVSRYIPSDYKDFLEIGGCPGRWAEYMHCKLSLISDSMDYDENNVRITKENYGLLNIMGKPFLGDITEIPPKDKVGSYDVVLSDGLIEHFIDFDQVFNNHVKYLKKGGLLVVGVPNIKESRFYNFLASRIDKESYTGYRHVSMKELICHAKDNDLKVLFCGYIGVFNLGVVHSNKMNFFLAKSFAIMSLISDYLLKLLNVKKETGLFSPAIYLIAKK